MTAVRLTLAQNIKAAVLPLVALLLGLALSTMMPPQQVAVPSKIAVGVRVLDENPLLPVLTASLLESPQVQELATLRLLAKGEPTDGLAVVITLPPGFTESIMTGENLSPTVSFGDTGIAGVYLGEYATAIERYLASAQAGIRATLAAAGTGLSQEDTARVLTDVNLRYMTLFLNRLAMLSGEYGGFDGLYLRRGVVTMLLCLFCLCLGGVWPSLFATARAMRGEPHSGAVLFAGGVTGVFLCCGVAALAGLTAAFGTVPWGQWGLVPGLAALLAAVSTIFFVALRDRGVAALALGGFILLTALLSGLIIPLEILPEVFTKLAFLWPIWHLRELVTVLSGGYNSGQVLLGAVLCAICWLGLGGLVWRRGVRYP